MRQIILPVILLFALNLSAEQPDTGTYEDELVFQLVDSFADGEVLWLGAQGDPFLSLFRPAENTLSKRVALILHSMGAHADWPEVIAPLRSGLSARGWSTLSIQLPVLGPQVPIARYGSNFEQVNARIRASVKYLKDKQFNDIVLIGYSFGATCAVNFLTGTDTTIRAFAGVSMQTHIFLSPAYNLLEHLENVSVPILDIYGSEDFSDVVATADVRKLVSRSKNSAYTQQMVEHADHYFSGYSTELVDSIAGWPETIVPANEPLDRDALYFL